MPRYRITLEYDGSDFVGWQRQDNGVSVQGEVESAASAIIGERASVAVQGAGRTDAGVHATGQVAHFDLPEAWDTSRLHLALNAHLPASIRVLEAEEVADDFSARFDAIKRCYRYRVMTRRVAPSLEQKRVWHVGEALDIKAMKEGAGHLIGHHDFTSFRAQHCQAKSPVRTLDILRFEEEPDGIALIAEAKSFLHNQVRAISGTLVEVGRGKISSQDVKAILEAKDRSKAGPTAPPYGLYLTRVEY